jgi:hypothetical protein
VTTPSGFHDEKWQQPGAHDILQQEFLDFLRQRPFAVRTLPSEAAAWHRDVVGEYPFVQRGEIVAFADAAEILTVNLTTIISLFEIKPRIDTMFGITRQIKAYLAWAEKLLPQAITRGSIVVPHTDPKIGDLRKEWQWVWAWGWQHEPEKELVNATAYRWAWKQACGSMTQKAVLKFLASEADASGVLKPSVRAISQYVQCDENTARDAVRGLVRAGLVRRERPDAAQRPIFRLPAKALQ